MDAEDYIAPQYELASSVSGWENAPRFGHISQISKLASFNNEEQVDYSMGVILFAAFMLTFFVFWTVALFVFMCMGQQEAGFLSGHPFVEPVKYSDPTPFRRPRRVRITFLICGILVIVFSILFVTEGLRNLEYTQTSLDESNNDVKQLVTDTESITQNLITVGEQSTPIRNELVARLGNFCPENPDIDDATGYDFDAMAEEGITYLNMLEGFIENEVADFKEGLETVKEVTNEVSRALNTYDVSDPKAMAYVIPVVILASFLIFGVLLAWCNMSFDALQCLLKWFIIPLFGIAIVFGWVLVSLFGFITTANSDVCSSGNPPSPDNTILEVLAEQGYNNPNELVYQAFVYYIRGCRTPFPFEFLTAYYDELNLALNATDVLASSIRAVGLDELKDMCGVEFDPVEDILLEANDKLEILRKSADLGLDLMSCESLNSIYVNTFHQAACTESITGLSWIFACLLVISVCGMVMLTLRAAVYDVIEVVDLSDLRLATNGTQAGDNDDEFYDKSYGEDEFPRNTMSQSRSQSGDYDDDYYEKGYGEVPPQSMSRSRNRSQSYPDDSVDSDPQGCDDLNMTDMDGDVDTPSVQGGYSERYDDDTNDPSWATYDKGRDGGVHK